MQKNKKQEKSNSPLSQIKDGWGSSTNFMLSYGLKPYNEEDCEEALEISRSLKGINDEMDFILVISIIINNIMSRGISP